MLSDKGINAKVTQMNYEEMERVAKMIAPDLIERLGDQVTSFIHKEQADPKLSDATRQIERVFKHDKVANRGKETDRLILIVALTVFGRLKTKYKNSEEDAALILEKKNKEFTEMMDGIFSSSEKGVSSE